MTVYLCMGSNKPHPISWFYVVDKATGCWLWIRALESKGYGIIRRDGRFQVAHRYVWSLYKGAVPKGKELHHICEVKRCVNPNHLKPVTHKKNTGLWSKGKCWLGHPLTKRTVKGKKINICRRCSKMRYEISVLRKKGIVNY